MKKAPFFSALLALLPLGLSLAQAQDADAILDKVNTAQKAARDLTFRLSGTATLDAGQAQKLDLNVQSIPASNLSRLVFNAPDALADNIVVLDGKEVRQYLYLTNQVTITTPGKALQNKNLPAGSAGGDLSGLDLTQLSNPAALKSRYDLKVLSAAGAAGNHVYQLQATPKAGGDKTVVWIAERGWQPTRWQLYSGGKVVADLNISNYKTNAGLNAAKLRSLPKDAEIIRQ